MNLQLKNEQNCRQEMDLSITKKSQDELQQIRVNLEIEKKNQEEGD